MVLPRGAAFAVTFVLPRRTALVAAPACARRPPHRTLTMVEPATFFNNIAEKYATDQVKDMAGYEDTLTRVRKYLTPSSNVLEVGCGTGTTALKLAGDARKIVATDIAPNMVAIGERKKAEVGVKNVDFSVCAAHEAPGKAGSYDVVLAMNLFTCVQDVPQAIAGLKEKVRPGGVVISKTTGIGGNILFRLAVPVAQFFKKAPQVSFFTNDELSKHFEDAGFEIVETHDYKETPKRRFLAAKKPES